MPTHPTSLLMQQFALIGHACSSEHRLKLLHLLAQAPKSVEALAEQTGQSIASASAHLKVLRNACLVESERRGKYVFYRLASEEVLRFWMAMQDLGMRQLPEAREVMRAYFEDRETLVAFTPAELATAAAEGKIVLLDVRPADEYAAGHLPHARSMPVGEIEAHLADLPRRKPVVVYCRGPFCVMAQEAVDRLRQAGLAARHVALGIAEWKAAGLELAREPLERP